MQLAVLFGGYKELALCVDRVRHVRKGNPDTPIYVLFGGEPAEAPRYEAALRPWVDDFYAFDEPPPATPDTLPRRYRGGQFWKYMYGDLLIASWYRHRGTHLPWDTVIVVQWDMLVYGRIDEVFACLGKDQILLSGLRPVRDVADRWVWVAPQFPRDHARYQRFLEHVRDNYGYRGEPKCCVAVVMCYPRCFLDKFQHIEPKTLGFMEYRIPIYAEAFGVPFCTEHPFKAWWGTQRYSLWSTLRARPREIWAPAIWWNLRRRHGARVFHPWWRRTPSGALGWTWTLLDAIPRAAIAGLVVGWKAARAKLNPRRPPPAGEYAEAENGDGR